MFVAFCLSFEWQVLAGLDFVSPLDAKFPDHVDAELRDGARP